MKQIHKAHKSADGGAPKEIIGPAQRIKLPFKCDADITVEKETLNFDMDDRELAADLEGNEQFVKCLQMSWKVLSIHER